MVVGTPAVGARELGFDYMEISIDDTDGAGRACGGAGLSARRCGS